MADNSTLPATGEAIRDIDRSGVKTQVVALDTGGAASESLVSPTNPLATSINAAYFAFSSVNTSSAELASGATFTGTIETALNQPDISVLLTSDQPITLTIEQFIDAAGVYPVPPIVYYVDANKGFSGSFPINGNYVRVKAKNTGTATTTTFELNTAYGTIGTSDGSGRTPIAKADCIPLLTTTISAAGVSSTIDTNGFGAVVTQLSGVWQGSCFFESSNDLAAWDSVLTFSRDSLSLQDIINSTGIYTVRPSGRYMRLTVTTITGTMSVSAIGRAAEGIAAADLLSLAMDRQNNTPLQVQLQGNKQDVQGALIPSDCAGPFYASATVANANAGVLTIDTQGYPSLTLSAVQGVGLAQVFFSDDQRTWCNIVPANYLSANPVGMANGGSVALSTVTPTIAVYPCVGRYAQVRFTAVTTAPVVASVTLRLHPAPQQIGFSASGGNIPVSLGANTVLMGDVGLSYRATTAGATAVRVIAAATDNKTVLKATAGRLYFVNLMNLAAYPVYIHLYNTAAASVTVGTTAPVYTIMCPATVQTTHDFGGYGYFFSNAGWCVAITKGGLDNDATATVANDFIANFLLA